MSDIKVRKKDIQEAKRPDAVLERAGSLFDWLVKYRTTLLGGIVALGVLAVAISVATASAASRKHELGARLGAAVEDLERPVGADAEGAAGKTFATKEERDKAVQEQLGAIVKEKGDTAAGAAARLPLARLALAQGKPDEAVQILEEYLKGDDQALRLFALENLGYAREAKGELDQAKDAFQKLGEAGAPGLALYHQARLLEKAGKKDEARKAYEQVARDFDKEAISFEARARLDMLDMPAPGTGGFEAAAAPPPEPAKPAKGKARKGAK